MGCPSILLRLLRDDLIPNICDPTGPSYFWIGALSVFQPPTGWY